MKSLEGHSGWAGSVNGSLHQVEESGRLRAGFWASRVWRMR
jgi:hypothetical protein